METVEAPSSLTSRRCRKQLPSLRGLLLTEEPGARFGSWGDSEGHAELFMLTRFQGDRNIN